MAWDVLTSADYGADVILTEATATALYDNPRAMAQRESSTPSLVQVPVREYKTSGTGATWTIPAGVTAFAMYLHGGGEEGFAGGTNGGDSTCTYNSVTYTGGGGGIAGSTLGGAATGGDLNVTGSNGTTSGGITGPGTPCPGYGGMAYGYGGRGAGAADGGSGALCIKRVTVVPGQTTVTYTVGAGGAGGGAGGDGGGGLIIFEY